MQNVPAECALLSNCTSQDCTWVICSGLVVIQADDQGDKMMSLRRQVSGRRTFAQRLLKSTVDRYLSPKDGKTTTISLPLFSGLWATLCSQQSTVRCKPKTSWQAHRMRADRWAGQSSFVLPCLTGLAIIPCLLSAACNHKGRIQPYNGAFLPLACP